MEERGWPQFRLSSVRGREFSCSAYLLQEMYDRRKACSKSRERSLFTDFIYPAVICGARFLK
jgi:hypothetical protein